MVINKQLYSKICNLPRSPLAHACRTNMSPFEGGVGGWRSLTSNMIKSRSRSRPRE